MLTSLTKGEGGVIQLLTITDKGGGGGQTPPKMADIICEQSLTYPRPLPIKPMSPRPLTTPRPATMPWPKTTRSQVRLHPPKFELQQPP